ncbi:hypothetical protein CPLU01_08733 [Colletotrichum plurivorum]|uniref:Clr5 domain-containing protein n=1 Tax=Colletotrichum plurivorum TaxID=2175906 RepID=A0A8H6KB03_9PEZI|nr:hypothetical protein CPLU01_08733 [Colletotrichum plurivorum]
MERDYWLYATKRMFRTRINKWGLDKKLKEDEVLEMLRLKRQRDAIGKRSHLEKQVRTAGASSSKVLDVSCRTPSPVPQLLQPALETRVQEDILRLLRDHINGCVEGRMWTVSRSGQNLYGLGQRAGFDRAWTWFRELATACHLLAAQRPNAAFSVLNRGLGSVKRLIRDNDPQFFCRTLERLLILPNDMWRSLVGFISEMHQVILGQQHPMSLIWTHIGYMNEESWGYFNDKLIECSKNCFAVYYSLGDHMVRRLHVMAAQRSRLRRYGDGDACSEPVLNYLQNAVASTTTDNLWDRIRTMLRVAEWQMGAGRNEAALEKLTQAGLLFKQRLPHYENRWQLQTRYYDCMDLSFYKTGDYEESVRYGLKAYEILRKNAGAGSPKTLRAASKIARTYEAIGNYEEANMWMGVLEESITDDFSNMTLGTAT